jgi:hypothetical protein
MGFGLAVKSIKTSRFIQYLAIDPFGNIRSCKFCSKCFSQEYEFCPPTNLHCSLAWIIFLGSRTTIDCQDCFLGTQFCGKWGDLLHLTNSTAE